MTDHNERLIDNYREAIEAELRSKRLVIPGSEDLETRAGMSEILQGIALKLETEPDSVLVLGDPMAANEHIWHELSEEPSIVEADETQSRVLTADIYRFLTSSGMVHHVFGTDEEGNRVLWYQGQPHSIDHNDHHEVTGEESNG